MRLQHSWRGEGEDRNGKVHFTSRIWIQELNTWPALAKELKGCCARHTRYLRVISSSISHRAQSGRNDDCFPNGKILIHFSVWREMPLFFNVWFVSWNREKSCPVDPPPLLPFNVIFSFWGGRVFSRHGALKNEWRVANGLSKKKQRNGPCRFLGRARDKCSLTSVSGCQRSKAFWDFSFAHTSVEGREKNKLWQQMYWENQSKNLWEHFENPTLKQGCDCQVIRDLRETASSICVTLAKWAVLGMPRQRIPWACLHSWAGNTFGNDAMEPAGGIPFRATTGGERMLK